jgi:hypothetical protein
MGEWLSKMFGRAASKSDTRGPVRQALQTALRARGKIYLESPDQGVVAATLIEQINQDEIVIAQPSIGGLTYPLAFGETLHISFVNNKTHLSGRTKCLGRVKVDAGAGRGRTQTLFAYRLSIPDALQSEERRIAPRTEIMPEIAPEANLYSGTLPAAFIGKLTSISMTGARLHTSQPLSALSLGQEVYLKCQMPEPVGLLDETVEVQRLEPDRRTGLNIVGVQFRRRIDRLETLMRFPSDRWSQSQTPMPQQQQRKTA